MKVLILGGTGYIGSAVAEHLSAAGHDTVIASRTPEATGGSETRVVDVADPVTLRDAITEDIDAVVHAATPTGDWGADLEAVDAILSSLRGTGRALIYLSGVWVLGVTVESVDETAEPRPIPLVSGRIGIERMVRDAADAGVRGIVIRPGIVHGRGGGIPGMMRDWARPDGIGRYVGSPDTTWPMVHLADLAELVVLALERAAAGIVLHGVTEEAVPVAEIARAASFAVGGTGETMSWPVSEAGASLGPSFAEALALSQSVGTTHAHQFAWAPRRLGAVDDVRAGSYADIWVQPASAAAARARDVEAIVDLVADVERAQQNEQADRFVAAFQPHAVWTTSHGARLISRDEIETFTRRVLPGAMRESTATYTVEHVLFLHDDIAVANVRQRPVTLGGKPLPGVPEGRPSYTLVRGEDGRWLIAAGHNTQVK